MAGQVWSVSSLGGYLYSDKLSKRLRMALQPKAKFRQFASVKDATAQGKKKGDVFTWDITLNVASAGGTLVETNTIPESNFTVAQGTGTVTEYGNGVPYSGKLDAMSMFDVRNIVDKTLGNDAAKVLDHAAWSEFDECQVRVVGTASNGNVWTSDGTATATNNAALYRDNVQNIIDTMKERNIDPYQGDDYACISHPSTLRALKDDLEDVFKYVDQGFQRVLKGEIGRAENCRFVEQTHIPKGGAADSTTFAPLTNTADAWDNAKSSWAFFFGDDTVAEGVAIPEEMRAKIPTDYGRSKGLAWYALLGYKIVHKWSSYPDQCRIVKWDSAE